MSKFLKAQQSQAKMVWVSIRPVRNPDDGRFSHFEVVSGTYRKPKPNLEEDWSNYKKHFD